MLEMTKKLLVFAAAALVAVGCGKEEAAAPADQSKTAPDTSMSLMDLPAFAALRSSCVTAPAWRIVTPATPVPATDGSITQLGVFHAPVCGSVNVGTVFTIEASCDGKAVTATVTVANEVVSLVAIPGYLSTDVKGACYVIGNATTPINGTVSWFAKIATTCGDFYSTTDGLLPRVCGT